MTFQIFQLFGGNLSWKITHKKTRLTKELGCKNYIDIQVTFGIPYINPCFL